MAQPGWEEVADSCNQHIGRGVLSTAWPTFLDI